MKKKSPTPTGHTPGPWKFVKGDGISDHTRLIVGKKTKKWPHGVSVCHVEIHDFTDAENDWPEGYANARLISAAPDLLAFTKRFIAFSSRMRPGQTFTSADIQGLSCDGYQAYEKAEGRKS